MSTDLLGSVVNLSDQYGRVTARTDYTDWGEVRRTTDITVNGGFRRLLPEITYATHEYDDVLNQFYAKARMYDAENKRFTAMDPIPDPSQHDLRKYIANPVQLVQYLYVADNAIIRVDILGERYSLKEGTIAHIVISAYIEGLYPGTISDTTLYNVQANKSGRGRPDIVIAVNNVYHVYEIKSDQYIRRGKYKTSSYRQLDKYIAALRSGDARNNINYPLARTARAGTVLNWDKHIILPYVADRNKVIETWTTGTPGMIYYKIRDRKKTDKVKDEGFVTAAVRAQIGYYAMIACENPPVTDLNLVNVDTYGDIEFNSDVIEWLDEVVVTIPGYTEVQKPYKKIEYPDGTVKYVEIVGYNWGANYDTHYTYGGLLNIYNDETGRFDTIPWIVTGGGIIPVAPILPGMPALPSMPIMPSFGPAFAIP